MQELPNLHLTNIDNTEDVFKLDYGEENGEYLKKGETEALESKIKFRSSDATETKNSNSTKKQISHKHHHHHHHKRGRSSKDSMAALKQKVGARRKKKCRPSKCTKQNRFHAFL